MNYTTLIENDRTPRHSLASIDPTTHIQLSEFGLNKDLCQTCRHRLFKKQEIEHKPIDCLTQRCESLEAEVTRLKDHDMKSRIYIKDLENKISALEDAMQALTAPKQQQATPYKIGTVNKIRPQLQKSQSSEDVPDNEKPEINYDNVLQPRRASQNRVGLFGSLGASSQHRHSLKP